MVTRSPPDGVEVATLGPDNWRELRSIRLEALHREPAAFSSTYADWAARPAQDWRRRLDLPGGVTLVARSGGRPIGMAGAILGADGDRHAAMIVGMYVNAGFRRQGVGRALMRALVVKIATHPDIRTIRLWVTPSQYAAQSLYASLGFRIVENPDRGMLDGPGADEEIAMERTVSEGEA
jgi:ribosomal protein S18 acetylase RimI-like enzyme